MKKDFSSKSLHKTKMSSTFKMQYVQKISLLRLTVYLFTLSWVVLSFNSALASTNQCSHIFITQENRKNKNEVIQTLLEIKSSIDTDKQSTKSAKTVILMQKYFSIYKEAMKRFGPDFESDFKSALTQKRNAEVKNHQSQNDRSIKIIREFFPFSKQIKNVNANSSVYIESNKTIAVLHDDKTLKIYQYPELNVLKTIELPDKMYQLVGTSDGSVFFARDHLYRIYKIDPKQAKVELIPELQRQGVMSLKMFVSPESNWFIVTSNSNFALTKSNSNQRNKADEIHFYQIQTGKYHSYETKNITLSPYQLKLMADETIVYLDKTTTKNTRDLLDLANSEINSIFSKTTTPVYFELKNEMIIEKSHINEDIKIYNLKTKTEMTLDHRFSKFKLINNDKDDKAILLFDETSNNMYRLSPPYQPENLKLIANLSATMKDLNLKTFNFEYDQKNKLHYITTTDKLHLFKDFHTYQTIDRRSKMLQYSFVSNGKYLIDYSSTESPAKLYIVDENRMIDLPFVFKDHDYINPYINTQDLMNNN